jgi:branched-chain amino acid transport system ATP-binding protein
MLEAKALSAGYGRARVLYEVSLEAHAGEVVALLGRNGAGKSTTLKALMGLVPSWSGEVWFDGRRIDRLAPHEIARLGLGYVPEDRRIFTDLTVRENLTVARQAKREGAPEWTPERLYALFPNLGAMPDRPGGRMSGGEQQMLTVARTLMGNPRVLLLDEPSEGLAPVIVRALGDQIAELKRQGLTILLSEQSLAFAARLADRAYIIEKGQIRFEGAMRELAESESLRRTYLTV